MALNRYTPRITRMGTLYHLLGYSRQRKRMSEWLGQPDSSRSKLQDLASSSLLRARWPLDSNEGRCRKTTAIPDTLSDNRSAIQRLAKPPQPASLDSWSSIRPMAGTHLLWCKRRVGGTLISNKFRPCALCSSSSSSSSSVPCM